MPFDPTKLTDTQLQSVIDHSRRDGLNDERYRAALAEQAKRKGKGLNFPTTIRVVSDAARAGRFISYGDVAEASGADWNQVHYAIGPHLDALIEYCHLHGLPLLSSIVVNQKNLRTGQLDPSSLKGFIAGVRGAKIPITLEAEEFLRQEQQKVFEWAKSQKICDGH
jgi:hypothetical protein